MSAAMVGAAIVGMGVGTQHALAYARLNGCRVRWLYDLEPERSAVALKLVGQGMVASSFEQIIADAEVDVVSIASFDDQHFHQAVSALGAKKHVFVEKPLCRDLAEARTLAHAQRSSGCVLRSNLVLRAAPLYRWLKTAIDSGDLGTIYAFDGDYLYGRLHKITDGWRANVDNYSVMMGGGVHLVDLMLFLLRERPTLVSAVGNRICTRDSAFRYDDFEAATFQFPSGLIGRITANFGCVHGHQHVVRVFGTKGTFIYDDRGARLQKHRDPAPAAVAIEANALPATKGDLIPDFIDAVRSKVIGESEQREFDLIAACASVQSALRNPGSAEKIEYHMTERREIPFGRPWILDEDRDAVLGVLRGHILTHGPECKAFEAEFAAFLGPGASCVTVSSCMAALHLSYLHFGIGPGDEVIVPAQTHTATAHAVEWTGARPVFVDCEPGTGNLTPAAIERAITPRTKALSLVHFAGIPCDMPAIAALAKRHNLRIVEDCAIALGARIDSTHVGLFGDVGCFSFYPVKHITTGEGGMLISRQPEVVQAIAKLRAFGVDRTHSERTVPGMYDVPSLGLNYRMSEMQAALGRVQLRRFTENLRRRSANFIALKGVLSRLPDVTLLDSPEKARLNSHYCMCLVLGGELANRRDEIVAQLNSRGVGTSIYYPQPVPRMSYYKRRYGYDGAAFPEATRISDSSIALPVGPHVDVDDMKYIGEVLADVVKEAVA